MSRSSQAKRAARAKARAQQRARSAARARASNSSHRYDFPAGWADGVFDRMPYDEASWDEECEFHAAESSWADPGWLHPGQQHGDPRARAREVLTSGYIFRFRAVEALQELDPAVVTAEAEATLDELVRRWYAGGWLPDELVRNVRLSSDASVVELARWAIGAERATRTGERVEPVWQARWERAEPVTVPDAHWLDRWFRSRHDRNHAAGLQSLLHLVDLWQQGRQVETLIAPPPGIVPVGQAATTRRPATTDPRLERVRALLAKAESTDHEAEATTFTAKAHELMTRYSIDEALLAADAPTSDGPGMTRLPLDPPYADAKALLLQTVADSMRCRALYLKEFQLSTVIGFASDLEGVELLFTSLLVQSHRALTDAIKGAEPGSHRRSQSYKSSFLMGFTQRVGDRLTESNRLTYADESAGTFLPVLQSREEKVQRMVEERFTTGATRHVRVGSSAEGYHQGRQAGDAARLSAGAVER